jgi:tetratricopeptide (TPR) repeat protein
MVIHTQDSNSTGTSRQGTLAGGGNRCVIIGRMSNQEPTPVPGPVPARKRRINLIWVFLGALLLIVAAGSVAGYFAGQQLHAERLQADILAFDLEQFQYAKTDIASGHYRRAVERLESILKNEPDFMEAEALKAQALAAMNATPTPFPTSTPVPSPTPDAPRAEQLLAQAAQQFTDRAYFEMIGTLLTLKVEIPTYQPERVDGLLWVALRYNGVRLIKETSRLTEGMYYLDLAANYAPLDSEAQAQIKFATDFLAVYQSAYYYRNKDIEVSLDYFRQAVSIRPYYSDTLIVDYADILVQIGDSLMNEHPCEAWWYYEQALAQVPDYEPAVTGYNNAKGNCGQSFSVPPEEFGPPSDPTPEP